MKTVERNEDPLTHEMMYRLLVNAITDYAIYMLDRFGYITSWNPGARRFKGYEAAEVLGKHFSIFYGEEDRQRGLPAQALEISARDGTFESEGWRIRKDGNRFWAHVVIDPIRDDAGNLLGFAKVTCDLIDRVRRDAIRKRSEDQFRLLVQAVTDYGIYMLDPEGKVSSWNAGAQKIKGYSEKEIIGQDFSVFYTEEDRQNDEPRRALETAAREGRFEKEGWRVRKDGSIFRANVVISPIRADNGAIAGFAKVTRDLTEATKTQAALKNARETLFQTQKMEAVGQLTGGVAHDFNNILTAVLGGLDILRRRLPNEPRITPLLENAIQAAERGRALTQRMLAFARRQELKPEAIDLAALVLGMTDLMQRSVGPAISIEFCIPPGLDPVYADPNQLELAVLNLVMNARDAMPHGGCIMLGAWAGSPLPLGKDCICLTVTNLGAGMGEATASAVEGLFATSKWLGKGIGLGLSMVDELAEQSGGCLIVRNQQGHGSIAELWLPVARTIARSEERKQAADHLQPLGVLAVDDDTDVVKSTLAMLEDLGHSAFGATCGEQALDIIRREKTLDLVIIDHTMPNITRQDLAEAMQSGSPSLQIVFTTPPASSSLVQLPKPFSKEELAQAISRTRHLGSAHATA